MSEKALKVIKTLQHHNFKAYFVGGCIRDLLLGKKPKDFDVSTDATPEKVRSLFQNSRIIGRRFKIVHVVFGNEIIEVTTFRSNKAEAVVAKQKIGKNSTRVSDKSGMLLRDNVYGKNIVEDSLRRDFTINALYLDPIKQEIYDYNGGLYDMHEKVIDIIGDPETRYSEDPVRMIRALRFSAKLDFKISKRSSDPIKKLSSKLLEVSNARMFEEVNKLFITGHGLASFKKLLDYHIFELLFPATQHLITQSNFTNFIEYALNSSDKRYQNNQPNMPHFLYSVILWNVFYEKYFIYTEKMNTFVSSINETNLVNSILDGIFEAQEKITAMPFVVSNSIRSLWKTQIALEQCDRSNLQQVESIKGKAIFRAAYDFLTLRARFDPFLKDSVDFWTPFYEKSKALSIKRRIEREQQKKTSKKKGKKKFTDGFAGEEKFSRKRKKALEKARAWRASMDLDI